MHLNNYGLKAIRAIYFEKLRLYEDSTKYANDVDVSRSAENVLLNVDDLIGANSIDDIHEVDYDFTPNNKKNKSGKFDTYKKYNDDIKKRIVKITGEPPKNNVHVGSIVFTLPDEFKNSSKKEQVDVFKNWLRFIGDRYGNENIIDCVLHFDETTPHGTVTIVPEAISRKTHKKTVSTASCFTLKDLHNLHKDCDAYFERIYGIEGLINNQKTIGKTKVAKQHLDAFKKERKEYDALTKQNNELKAENQLLQGAVNAKQAEYDKLDTDVKNKLNEANNKASDIIDKAKTKAKAEAERIKQAADIDIKNRENNLDAREKEIIAREDKYTKDTDTFYKVTYPKYKKDKKDLDDKEKELDKRLTWLDAREVRIIAGEADLLQREYEVITDRNYFYNNTYRKKKKELEDKEKNLDERKNGLDTREAGIIARENKYKKDKKDLDDKESELADKETELKKFEADVVEYQRYKPLHRDIVSLYAFWKSDYFGPFPIRNADEFKTTFIRERESRKDAEALNRAYKEKYGDLSKSEKPYESAKPDINAIMGADNKKVAEWEKREKEKGFEPFG